MCKYVCVCVCVTHRPANIMISGNLHADGEQLYLDAGVMKVRFAHTHTYTHTQTSTYAVRPLDKERTGAQVHVLLTRRL